MYHCNVEYDSNAWQQEFEQLLAAVTESPGTNSASWGARGLDFFLNACDNSQRVQSQSKDTLLQRALILIRENAHRPFTVKDLAYRLSTTERTLERHFAKSHVRSPRHEIIHVRLERASRMLASAEIPIKEIAYTCGFGNPKLMNYNFQRFRQTTPGQLREQLVKAQISASETLPLR